MSEDFELMVAEVEELVDNNAYDFEVCPTRNKKEGPYFSEDVVAALYQTLGSVSNAARLLGRRRTALREYIDRNPLVLDYHAELSDSVLDRIEYNVYACAIGGDMNAARFVLSTKGKNRGWTTRQELTGKDGDPIRHEATPRERIQERLNSLRGASDSA